MTAKDIIYEVITKNEQFSTIKLNTKTNKIELNGETILQLDYDDILEACKAEYPDTKFSKQIVKDIVTKYARDNKYEPVVSKSSIKKTDWYASLEFDENDNVKHSLTNVIKFLEKYPYFEGKFAYNEFTAYENFEGNLIRDYNISEFRKICDETIGFDSKDKVECAVQYLTHQNTFNPFKDAIDELIWDGQERAESFFIDFVGVHDTKLNRSLTKKFLFAMIKRLYEPGCSMDCMLIVYDAKQGTGKSKIMERLVFSLGVDYGYSTSITCDNKDKDNVDKLNHVWVVGIDEMADFLKKNPEQTKQFLAQTTDQARLSYAKRSEVYKRHCVFYGNSNLEFFLKDYTSNFERRYWIMEANGEVHDALWWKENLTDEYCQQIIAEMKYFYDNNPDFIYNTLSIEETKELSLIQYKHKTLNNDDIMQDDIYEVLDKTYSKKLFDSYAEWKAEADSEIVLPTPITSEFFGETVTDTESAQGKIDRIPVKWLKRYIKDKFNRTLSTQYVTALISLHWEYKPCKYLKTTVNCYTRL